MNHPHDNSAGGARRPGTRSPSPAVPVLVVVGIVAIVAAVVRLAASEARR